MAPQKPLIYAQLDHWAEELIDLTQRNSLLYFKYLKVSSFGFEQSASEVQAGLSRSKNTAGWSFYLPEPPPDEEDNGVEGYEPDPPRPTELVVAQPANRYRPQIEQGLKKLATQSQAYHLETGIWTLYLGLGLLSWHDDDKDVTSPLLLVPVRLKQRSKSRDWQLISSDNGDTTINPALLLKLQEDFDISLPGLDQIEDQTCEAVFNAIKKCITKTSWSVMNTAVLRMFTFHKEVIYQDLKTNRSTILNHPLVQLLAEGPTSTAAQSLNFMPVDEDHLDEVHPPERLASILDVDGTQRQCLAAAGEGKSFVMDGPPGTGKSQTIANLIAQLLRDKKTVLFVSEKAAALEVVQTRLAKAGLEAFLLPLHSHKASRKAVIADLGIALSERLTVPTQFSEQNRTQLEQERNKLSAYAIAVNEIRSPLEKSFHDAVGRISKLSETFIAPIPDTDTTDCDSITFNTILSAAARLGRAWGPVSRGDDFVWRDLEELSAGGPQDSSRRRFVTEVQRSLADLKSHCELIHKELKLPGESSPHQAKELFRLLELIEIRPQIGWPWLMEQDLQSLEVRIRQIADGLDERNHKISDLAQRVSDWSNLDPASSERFQMSLSDVESASPTGQAIRASTAAKLKEISQSLDEIADSLGSTNQHVKKLARAFGYRNNITIEFAERLAKLGKLTRRNLHPEADWLNQAGLDTLDESQRALQPLVETYGNYQASLESTFRKDVLQLELVDLHARFRDVHKGIKKLSRAYRQDKRTLAKTTRSGKTTPTTISKLDEVINWQTAAKKLEAAERRHAAALGSYYPDKDEVDFAVISKAAEIARCAIEFAGLEVNSEDLASQLSKDAEGRQDLSRSSEVIEKMLNQLRSSPTATWLTSQLQTFESIPINLAIEWSRARSIELTVLATELDAIDSELDSPRYCTNGHSIAPAGKFCVTCECTADGLTTVEQGCEILLLRHQIEKLTANLNLAKRQDEAVLGRLTNVEDGEPLRSTIDWVREVKTLCGGKMHQESARLFLDTELTQEHLGEYLEGFKAATIKLLNEFKTSYATKLAGMLHDSYELAEKLLSMLTDSIDDTHEWVSFAQAKQILHNEGLTSVVNACVDQKVTEDQVSAAIETAFFTRWVGQVVESDKRLKPYRGVDRDALRKSFQDLDAKLISNSAAEVILSCTQQRPSTNLGGVSLIRQQAELKNKHMSLRKLFMKAGETIQQLKPCFMMSPLTVSQHIPPEMRFDYIIFDEASQVREADAICAIYRGDQLIVAGDQKQLPPTRFFDRMLGVDDSGDEGEDEFQPLDFESVLDRCKAQGFTSLDLRWHYRSRHENLITFSNQKFYDSKLYTFPGAVFKAPNLGVEMFKVDGIYARGGAKNNPLEAAKVVERILFHRQNHPKLSIGVVALSTAQEDAVLVEIERRATSEPELAQLATDDRLHGFFVKNLESVQGDERDIIILTIGYGPDEHGKLTMNFGPINQGGGERRLNVAVTRARNRVEVISSISGTDIRSTTPSVDYFATYLKFAEHGISALAAESKNSQGGTESAFEEQVLSSIKELGYEPVSQVGVAGYRIDIGVRHPEKPGCYLLGVECDGASYHSSRVARDRDRIRQQILEGLGWQLHRIWSTAWFTNRAQEEWNLREALETAASGRGLSLRTVASTAPAASPEVEIQTIDLDRVPSWVVQYTEPKASKPDREYLNFTENSSRPTITRQILEVVQQYGPIHCKGVRLAVQGAWDVGRTGQRVQDAFNRALRPLLCAGEIEKVDDFLSLTGQRVEVRGNLGAEVEPRPVEEVPPEELQLAIHRLLADTKGPVKLPELRTLWRKLFGWHRSGKKINIAFQDALAKVPAAGDSTKINNTF